MIKYFKETLFRVYCKFPVFIQNIIISIYGIKINAIRHGKDYYLCINEIEKRINYRKVELIEYQKKAFIDLMNISAEQVPYYKKIFERDGLLVKNCIDLSFLKKIPFLEKSSLRKNENDFINNVVNLKNIIRIHTTGTTGTPLNIYCNYSVRQTNYAYYDRFLRLSGIDYRKLRATFGGRIIVPQTQKNPPFWRYSYFQKNVLFSSYHLRDSTIQAYIDKLIQIRPHYIDAYPSSIYAIADYAYRHGIDLQGVTEGITTSAETLFDDQRTTIEQVFGVPVVDQYGSVEMCVFIGQCSKGSYHVHTDYSIVEFLREDGSEAGPGEEAEVVCTGLINPVMPLIRYRIGDKVVVSDKQCACGCIFPVVEKILGRADDFIITPEGNRIGRLSPVLKGFPVKEAQYVQDSVHAVTVRLVKDMGFSNETEDKIIEELRKRLGQKIKLYFEYVDSIDRGVGAKRKTVISTIK